MLQHVHRSSPTQRAPFRSLLALFCVVALLLAACSDDGDAATSADRAFETEDTADDGAAAPAVDENTADDEPDTFAGDDMLDSRDDGDMDASDDTTGDSGEAEERSFADLAVPAEITALAVGRQIIFTGEVVVESADVAAATDDVIDAVFQAGGAIWGQETRSTPDPQTVLTIRVPPLDFDAVLDAIAGIDDASLISQSISTDDVTETVVDLNARITAAESSVARVQTLLDAANDLNTVFTLEEELAARQAQLERLRGQRETIGGQIALATITLTIVELDPDRLEPGIEVVAWLGTDTDDACPGSSNLSIGADDTAVLCVNVSNTGDDVLTDIEVTAPTFRLRTGDFTIEPGSATIEAIEAGDELLLTVELDAEDGFIQRVDASDGLDIGVAVNATPATTASVDLTASDSVFISADVEDPLPGFGESFSAGFGAMLAVLSILMVVVGALLPFIPLVLLAVWLGRKFLARRRAAERMVFDDGANLTSAEADIHQPPVPPAS